MTGDAAKALAERLDTREQIRDVATNPPAIAVSLTERDAIVAALRSVPVTNEWSSKAAITAAVIRMAETYDDPPRNEIERYQRFVTALLAASPATDRDLACPCGHVVEQHGAYGCAALVVNQKSASGKSGCPCERAAPVLENASELRASGATSSGSDENG